MLNSIVHPKFITSLEFSSNGFKNVLVLRKEKKELLVEKNIQVKTIAQAATSAPENSPLVLVINTEKVLFKTIANQLDPQKAIAEGFPNLKIEDFYYEILNTDSQTCLAICRKDDVKQCIKECQENNLNVIGFSLGNLAISNIASLISNETIQTSNSSIIVANNNIDNISISTPSNHSSHTINGLEVSNNYVLPLAGIIGYYTKQQNTISNFEILTNELNTNFRQKRLFDVGLKTSLALVFFLLLISFLFFSNYNTKINTINSEIELNKTYKNSLVTLSNNVTKKERLVNDFSLASSKTSWYLDQIGKSIPLSILLSEIQLQPLKKGVKKDEEIAIEQNQIILKGKASNNIDFTNWTNKLEQLNWIDKITIQEYGSGKKITPEFQLLVNYKH